MSVTVHEVLEIMQRLAPPELACSWDNVGLLVDAGRPVTAIATALDITDAVVREAVAAGCELIVSHHPVIFNPLRHIAADDVPALLLQNGISAICMHTNLDAADGGVNDTLAAILEMHNCESFAEGCGRIGTVSNTTTEQVAKACIEKLGARVKYVNPARAVERLAVVSGAGGSYLQGAIDLGADCLVTGEAAHHIALLAKKSGVGLVVAGHWATERPVALVLAEKLKAELPEVKITAAKTDTDPYLYL